MDAFAAVAEMVRESERHADDTSKDRIRAIEYYRGEMTDTPAEEGRSSMVSRDLRAHVKKVLPSIIRTIMGNDEVVEYQPVGPGDEDGAEQASDYVNFVLLGELGARDVIYDAVHDALLQRNGIIKWWFEERASVTFSSHSGLTDIQLAELVSSDDVEIVEHEERAEDVEGQPLTVHDVRIKRATVKRQPRIAAVPRERFLIHPEAVSLEDSLLTGEVTTMRRSDLVAMGYERDLVFSLPIGDGQDSEEAERRDFVSDTNEAQKANENIDYYDLYVRADMDGDGIAELRHMCFAGGLTEKHLLEDDECDEVQFADVAVMRQPHQWEGISLADDLMDLQRAKTVLTRQTLDNLYWQNNPQPIASRDAVEDHDAVLNPGFGKPIWIKAGRSAAEAIGFSKVPFVARESFGMLEYLDQEAADRTGITDASAGLAPDALQNMTAKASAMIEQAGIGQTEMMVRTVAEGLAVVFRGLLRLIIRHQDVPRTVRLRGEWVEFDPRHWNAEMDAKVNTGLGAGTRERDMAVMQSVLALQEKLLTTMGPDNPFVKPENLYASLSRLVEAAGLRTPSLYFTEPDPEEVQARLEAMRNAPNPEAEKIKGQMALEQAKMQAARDKEMAQMQADLRVEQARLAADSAKAEKQMAFDREKMARSEAIKVRELNQEREIELLKLGMRDTEVGPQTQTEEHLGAMMQALMGALDKMAAASNTPKRLIYDERGEIVGVEPMVN